MSGRGFEQIILEKDDNLIEIIQDCWTSFVLKGKSERDSLPDYLYESWKRSLDYEIDPLMDEKKLRRFYRSNYAENFHLLLDSDIVELNENLEKIADINRLSFSYYRVMNDGSLFCLFSNGMKDSMKGALLDIHTTGTSASILAVEQDEVVVVAGPMHYLKLMHNFFCVSAPVHSKKGQIIGVLNLLRDDFRDMSQREIQAALDLADKFAHIMGIFHRERAKVAQSQTQTYSKPVIHSGTLYCFSDIIGEDRELIRLKKLGMLIAKTDLNVLVHGDNGTGKEMFAQSIHDASHRAGQPFIPINCAAIPAELIESELFGYERGAFTGADQNGKIGKLEAASGGTLFLDEIESMSLMIQAKLLRALSSKKVSKIGSTKEIDIDVRIISATKCDLLKNIAEGSFREDFYYRINTFEMKIPSLRDRKTDIPLLVEYFMKRYQPKGTETYLIADEFMESLIAYNWSGNIRELRNVVQRAVFLAEDTKKIDEDCLPEKIAKAAAYRKKKKLLAANEKQNSSLEEGLLKRCEEMLIKLVLEETGGRVGKAAEILGMTRQSLSKKQKGKNN